MEIALVVLVGVASMGLVLAPYLPQMWEGRSRVSVTYGWVIVFLALIAIAFGLTAGMVK